MIDRGTVGGLGVDNEQPGHAHEAEDEEKDRVQQVANDDDHRRSAHGKRR